MPFHKRVPSPSTTLLSHLRKVLKRLHIHCRVLQTPFKLRFDILVWLGIIAITANKNPYQIIYPTLNHYSHGHGQ